MNAPAPTRQFKDIKAIRAAVNDIAKADNIPTIVYPSSLAKAASQPMEVPSAASETPTTPADVPAVARKPRTAKKERAVNVRVAVDLPDYVVKAIAKAAVNDECTKRFLFLKALRSIGITVNDVDMEEDGRRAK